MAAGAAAMRVWPGSPHPLGATWDGARVGAWDAYFPGNAPSKPRGRKATQWASEARLKSKPEGQPIT